MPAPAFWSAPVLWRFGLATALALMVGCATSPSTATAPSVAARPDAEAKLKELGVELPVPTAPVAVFKPVVVTGKLAFVSGHVSVGADGKRIAGKVGEDLDTAAGKAAAQRCGISILAALRQELGSLNRVKRVVKTLGMVNCGPTYKDQPQVINGCSELWAEVFGKEHGIGARSAVGVGSLPGNAAVEIEAIFEIE